jgi:undecaprenyl-phosphate galactose phosphotransferase
VKPRAPVDHHLVLLGRAVRPRRRTAVPGDSPVEAAYSIVNRVLAALIIVALSPLLLFIAWQIRKVDGAPVFFAHGRVGRRGRIFRCLKFRSMVLDSDRVLQDLLRTDPAARAEWERDQKLRHDPRITPIGRFLRKTSLDELPQLFNILAGDMHFVGPRPVTLEEVRRYGPHKRHYLSVRPGLTGLWQVSGRNTTTYARRVQLDARYVERRNPLVDFWIVLRTLKVVALKEGAH